MEERQDVAARYLFFQIEFQNLRPELSFTRKRSCFRLSVVDGGDKDSNEDEDDDARPQFVTKRYRTRGNKKYEEVDLKRTVLAGRGEVYGVSVGSDTTAVSKAGELSRPSLYNTGTGRQFLRLFGLLENYI